MTDEDDEEVKREARMPAEVERALAHPRIPVEQKRKLDYIVGQLRKGRSPGDVEFLKGVRTRVMIEIKRVTGPL